MPIGWLVAFVGVGVGAAVGLAAWLHGSAPLRLASPEQVRRAVHPHLPGPPLQELVLDRDGLAALAAFEGGEVALVRSLGRHAAVLRWRRGGFPGRVRPFPGGIELRPSDPAWSPVRLRAGEAELARAGRLLGGG